MEQLGAVAAGHPLTADTAKEVLRAGGNAFDAAIAAHFTACVAEPVLASLGGGGFLLAQTKDNVCQLYDFFVQTPRYKKAPENTDFSGIIADFGTVQQEFHIRLGAIATPGTVKGLFEVHRRLGTMPIGELTAPAIDLARQGVEVNAFQGYIFNIVSTILRATPESEKIYTQGSDKKILEAGNRACFPELADCLEALAHEGDELFYRGEIACQIAEQCAEGGGHLKLEDMQNYQVVIREPLSLRFRGDQILTNPPPSSGGILIAFALQLWEKIFTGEVGFGEASHLALLAEIMSATNQARVEAHLDGQETISEEDVLNPDMLRRYQEMVRGRAQAIRGTTHISVVDRWRNVATMTVSNGEGCGHVVPGTGVMLNNMLGEEDLNPHGFYQWAENQRMTSMMSPSIINRRDGSLVALGSGGSNRIRTALLQSIINLIDFDMNLNQAIASPRIHFENDLLNIEAGFAVESLAVLRTQFDKNKVWDDLNLFFGGVHAVMAHENIFDAVGDRRRGGVGI